MSHGDQQGLIIPPLIAPIQVVIIPIYRSEEQKNQILELANKIKHELQNNDVRIIIDNNEHKTPGAKFFEWEVKGVPVRMEIGPKDVEKNQVVLVNRATNDKVNKKQFIAVNDIYHVLKNLFTEIQKILFDKAEKRCKTNWYQVDTLNIIEQQLEDKKGFYQTGWCGNPFCEEKLKPIGGSIRCIIKDSQHKKCFVCGKPNQSDVIIAKAY
jgi:prolyl-tRNA synthetase